MAEALLALRNVEVRYGSVAVLKVPALSVDRSEILAVIGPNGSGKSTLIRVMGLLQQPERGEVQFDGAKESRRDALSVRRRIATVFQEPLLLNATVYENATLGLKLRGFGRKSAAQRVQPWLERFGIEHLAQRRARSLSGGEAHRTSLVRALALDPELLLLDEPFSALDPLTRERLLLELQSVLRETAITTVFVTHDRNEAFMLADRIAVLMGGNILQIGSAAEVFTQPADDKVAEFVGIETRIPGIVEEAVDGAARVRISSASAEVAGSLGRGERVFLCLRPEDIALGRPGTEDLKPSAPNQFLGKVTKVTPWGSHYRVAVKHGSILFIAFITRRSFLELQVREGANVVASFEPSAAHVIRHRSHE
jgi:tungstate transport system ATP-binding protein